MDDDEQFDKEQEYIDAAISDPTQKTYNMSKSAFSSAMLVSVLRKAANAKKNFTSNFRDDFGAFHVLKL